MVTHRRAMQELNVPRKMAHCASATFCSCHSGEAKSELGCEQNHVESTPEDGASASVSSSAPLTKANRACKHSLQMLVRSPCQHSGSTTASSVHSIPPSSWQNLHCNRKEG